MRRNRERTVQQWEQEVREIPAAERLELAALRDHIPALLDRVIESIELGTLTIDTLPDEHARTRIDQGFSLEQIAEEYRILRMALIRLLQAEPAPLEAGALLLLNDAIDHAVARALSRYHQSRARTLAALERLSQEALTFAGDSLRDLLRRFLGVILDTTEDVDTAVIYLREWDRLVIRAAVGIEAPVEDRFSLAIGEGIAGTVAAERRPYFTHSAATDSLARNPILAQAGVKALYAVPLITGNELIGVAKMGSRSADDFSQDDRQLFTDMTQRVSALVLNRQLAEERELFLGVLGHDLRSPLTTIGVGVSFLNRHEKLSAPGARTLHRIGSAAQRIHHMMAGLTDFTKVRFGAGLAIEPHVLDLGDELRGIVSELRSFTGREIRLELEGDPVVEWDEGRIGQLVTNLVNNAIIHGDPSAPVTVKADGSEEARVTLCVHNQGPPIAPGLVPHLFEAFRRGHTEVEGMGLGLYIVQHVAKAHGGAVTVESTREGGTTFTAHLPRWPKR